MGAAEVVIPKLVAGLAQQQTLSEEQIQSVRLLAMPSALLAGEAESLLASNPLVEAHKPTHATSHYLTDEELAVLHRHEDFREELLSDCRCLSQSDLETLLLTCLVDELDDRGFITTPINELAQEYASLLKEEGFSNVSIDAWEKALETLQRFEPPGLATSGPKEALQVQLTYLLAHAHQTEDNARIDAILALQTLLSGDLAPLLQHDRKKLLAKLRGDEQALDAALALLPSLTPYPLQRDDRDPTTYVTADLLVHVLDGVPVALLNQSLIPQVALKSEEERENLKKVLPAALWETYSLEARQFLSGLSQRKATLLRLGELVVRHQRAWLLDKKAPLKPLTMTEAAERLGLALSTVSRAVAGKYLLTPHGLVEFKSLFVAAHFSAPEQTGDVLLDAIRALIHEENPAKPLSDQALADALKARGITCARRTVTKYRELHQIPAARLRKRLDGV